MKKLLYVQTEIGIEKYCKGCDDYYPATKQFFFGRGRKKLSKDGSEQLETLCKPCYNEKYSRSLTRSYDVQDKYIFQCAC